MHPIIPPTSRPMIFGTLDFVDTASKTVFSNFSTFHYSAKTCNVHYAMSVMSVTQSLDKNEVH